jgi:hypothetical protein
MGLALAAGLFVSTARPVAAADLPVDVEIVFAVDVSYSMDEEEQKLQRQGYASAMTSPEVLAAIGNGRFRRIAVAYVEWAGSFDQRLLVEWRLIDSPAAATAWANELLAKNYRRISRTSISGGLLFSMPLFDNNGYAGERRVIDVSGDGANNQGPLVVDARDQVLSRGIVINGLPLLLKRQNFGFADIAELDIYYEDCVIGGEGSFMIPIRDEAGFQTATRMKLLLEVAGLQPDPAPVKHAAGRPTISCTVGEEMWRQRQEWQRN